MITSEPLVFSFLRNRSEHMAVMLEAGRQMNKMHLSKKQFVLREIIQPLLFITSIVLLYPFYETHYLNKFLDDYVTVLDVIMLITWPVGLCLVTMLILAYQRKRDYKAAIQTRLNDNILVTVAITEKEIVWDFADKCIQLAWKGITDIRINQQRLEFEAEIFVCYISLRAFRDSEEQNAVYNRVVSFWRMN